MTPVGMNGSTALHHSSAVNTSAKPTTAEETKEAAHMLKSHADKVTLSAEGKALLAAWSDIDKESKADEKPTEVKSFAYGALGLNNPEKAVDEKDDSKSYTAGQYVKGALSVGAILLALA